MRPVSQRTWRSAAVSAAAAAHLLLTLTHAALAHVAVIVELRLWRRSERPGRDGQSRHCGRGLAGRRGRRRKSGRCAARLLRRVCQACSGALSSRRGGRGCGSRMADGGRGQFGGRPRIRTAWLGTWPAAVWTLLDAVHCLSALTHAPTRADCPHALARRRCHGSRRACRHDE